MADIVDLLRATQAYYWQHVEPTRYGCWLWKSTLTPAGYGMWSARRHSIAAHRASWILHYGAIPEGLFVCHRCDTRNCVRPDHLFLGTNVQNMADCVAKGRTAKGERSAMHLYPASRARGERNGMYTHPECRRKGEANHKAKLTWDDVRAIRARYKPDPARHPAQQRGDGSLKALAREYGVADSTISAIVKGQGWQEDQGTTTATPST